MDEFLLEHNYRSSTLNSHTLAVERVILNISERLDDPPSLVEMAALANLSPHHFTHVFHRIIGIAPREFLAALRLETAKQLLLTTARSVTEICFDVGYNSLGTFTKRFTRFVGFSPNRLREVAKKFTLPSLELLREYSMNQDRPARGSVTGCIHVPLGFEGLVFIGLFLNPLPQDRPVGCALLMGGDTYSIPCKASGHYYIFAVAFVWQRDPIGYLLSQNWLRGDLNRRPVSAREDQITGSTDVWLRPTRVTDPPVPFMLPFLLAEHLVEATFHS